MLYPHPSPWGSTDITSKPRTARSARALKARESQIVENPKTTLFLHYTSCSQLTTLLFADLYALKRTSSIRFTKKNAIHPFEDASSLEFFAEKNDASLMLFGSTSKKRPHAMTVMRMFENRVSEMLELLVVPETLRTLSQFKNERKAGVGLKPLLAFCGTPFESPQPNEYTLAKSLFIDLFKGDDVQQVDVEGLQYLICFSAADEDSGPGSPKPQIHMRCYLIRTKRSGQRLPRVEVEEMGPRVDFRVGRMQAVAESVMKEAMRKPRGAEPKAKKNIETDLMGDRVGRIHLGKQDLGNLQTRKMKGLKRNRHDDGIDAEPTLEENDVKRLKINGS